MIPQEPYRPPRANREARPQAQYHDEHDNPASPKQIAINAAVTVMFFSAIIISIVIVLLGFTYVSPLGSLFE